MARPAHTLILLLLAGCASQAPAPVAAIANKPPAGMALLTITRTNELMYVAVSAQIDVNGARAASLSAGDVHSMPVAPGSVTISVDTWSQPGRFNTRFTAEAGKSYRFVVSPRGDKVAAGMAGAALFGPVGAMVAMSGDGPFKIEQAP